VDGADGTSPLHLDCALHHDWINLGRRGFAVVLQ